MKNTDSWRAMAFAARDWLRSRFSHRFSIHLTVEGWCLVITMMLIGLAALNTAAPLLYLMFSMMCAFFILSAILATQSIRRITLRRIMPRVWQAGMPMNVAIRARNGKSLMASYSLRIRDMLQGGGHLGSVFFDSLPPNGAEKEQTYDCLFMRRGVYSLKSLKMATRFPFGLIERIMTFDRPEDVLVLPQTISVDARMQEARADLGDEASHQRGFGAGLHGLRDYAPGMSARDIHWKVSARRGALMVREYETEERRRAAVVLDNRMIGEDRARAEEVFERAVVLAASAVEWLCKNDHEVELRTASGTVAFGSGPTHLTRCRRTLARLEMIGRDEGNASFLRGDEEGVVIFPIVVSGMQAAGPGRFPLPVEEFASELESAFRRQVPVVEDDPEE